MSRTIIPNSTPTPDVIVDRWMRYLDGAEFKITMLIVRETFGWGRKAIRMGARQIQKDTGIKSRTTVFAACASLAEVGVLLVSSVHDGRTENEYSLNLEAGDDVQERLRERAAGPRRAPAGPPPAANPPDPTPSDASSDCTSPKNGLVQKMHTELVQKMDQSAAAVSTTQVRDNGRDTRPPYSPPPLSGRAAPGGADGGTGEGSGNSSSGPRRPPDDLSPPVLEAEFEALWALHPRKEKKPAARAAYRRARHGASREAIAEGHGRWRASEQWRRGIVPQLANWLGGGQWEDEPFEAERRPRGSPPEPPPGESATAAAIAREEARLNAILEKHRR